MPKFKVIYRDSAPSRRIVDVLQLFRHPSIEDLFGVREPELGTLKNEESTMDTSSGGEESLRRAF
jgi:hypothetical protein